MKLHVFPGSPNSKKTILVNALLDLGIEIKTIDLLKGEQKAENFLALNPNGKTPVLEFDDGSSLWESNAIINRLAADAGSDLYPQSAAVHDILRWQFWESCHWTPACEPFIAKHFFNQNDIDLNNSAKVLHPFAAVLDAHLAGRQWLAGENMTTADISVSAMLHYRRECSYPLDAYANINRWMETLEALPAWKTAKGD